MKKYDVFTFFNELDLLDIRLNILDDYVDYFVIVECNETFSGNPKKLFYENNKALFKKYHHKIIHHITDDVPKNFEDARTRLETETSEIKKTAIQLSLTSDNVPSGAVHWLKEFYQKELLKVPLEGLDDDDFCFISDLDEIWNPHANIDFNSEAIQKFNQLSYCYFLNNRSDEQWDGTLGAKYKNIKNNCLNHLRMRHKTPYVDIFGAGWHFTNIGGPDQIRKKLESYGHQEYNNEGIKSQIEKRIENNEDFIGRPYRFWADESNLPQYIIDNKDKYKHLLKDN